MRTGRAALFMALAAGIALSSCGKLFPSPQDGECSLRISISSGTPSTRGAADGDVINTLRVYLVKEGENTVSLYSGHLTPSAASATVNFTQIDRGDYTLYAVANTTLLDGYVQGSTIDGGFTDMTLPATVDSRPPFSGSDGMPLSLVKSVSIGPGHNRVSAELLRVCGRIRVILENWTTDKAVFLSSARLGDRNPDTGYLFAKEDHSVPPSTAYGPFSDISGVSRTGPGERNVVIDQYLYESGRSGEAFSLSLKGGIFDSGVQTAEMRQSYRAGTNTTDISGSDRQYLIANSSDLRYFLKAANTSSVSLSQVSTDTELLSLSDISDYLWSFSSSGSTTSIKNIGYDRSLSIGSGTVSLTASSASVSTSVADGVRRFYYYQNWRTSYYLYKNAGSIAVGRNQTGETSGWYLREVSYGYDGLFRDADKDIIYTVPSLSYTDRYGQSVTLKDICRNDDLTVKILVYYSDDLNRFIFEVEPWDVRDNETTFD